MDRITKEKVFAIINKEPRRRCFAKDNITYEIGKIFNFPFGGSITKIFKYETKLDVLPSKHSSDGYYLYIDRDYKLDLIRSWVNKYSEIVFLRDCLDMSLALNFNVVYEDKVRTEFGQLEYRAKYHQNKQAIEKISNIVEENISKLPFYKDADCICAVPAHPRKKFDLPNRIVQKVSQNLNKPDITQSFIFDGTKESIKTASVEVKWSILEKAKISCRYNLTNQTIILFDDKYQSGITMQYVAMKLYQAGAKQVYGLCFVKTLKNTDNTSR